MHDEVSRLDVEVSIWHAAPVPGRPARGRRAALVEASGASVHMVHSDRVFRMEERFERDGSLRLIVIGELDVAVVDLLSSRLGSLRKEGYDVRLDMSRLKFIDSSGMHELLRQVGDSRRDGWNLVLDGPLTDQVARTIDLLGARAYLWPEER